MTVGPLATTMFSVADALSEITAADVEPLTAEAFRDFVTSGPLSARAAVGARTARIGGGVATSVPGDPTGAWTRVQGLGITAPLTAQVFDDLRRFYARDEAVQVTLTLAPSALPADWEALSISQDLVGLPGGHKLVRDVRAPAAKPPPAVGGTELRVAAITPATAQRLGELMVDVFGMGSGPLATMVAGVLDRDGWHGFGVWTGAELVAGALVRISGEWAHLIGAVTRPHARRRGAQSALTSARLSAAREAGCRWAMVEPDVDLHGQSTSLRNMRAAGFSTLFPYPSWSWSPRRVTPPR